MGCSKIEENRVFVENKKFNDLLLIYICTTKLRGGSKSNWCIVNRRMIGGRIKQINKKR